jgi:hypothetical protein
MGVFKAVGFWNMIEGAALCGCAGENDKISGAFMRISDENGHTGVVAAF